MYKVPPHNQIPSWDDILYDCFGYKEDGFFVEVGAYNGVQWSPSCTLARAGWAGIFFEPQTRAYRKLLGNYMGEAPRIRCVQKAISNYSGTAKLYLGGSVSTIVEDTKKLYLTIPEFQSTGLRNGISENVVVATLDDELKRLEVPLDFDLLVIDVEGSELHVLEKFEPFFWRPRMIVIEAHEHFWNDELNDKAAAINVYMLNAEYTKIYSDHINNIYVRHNDA